MAVNNVRTNGNNTLGQSLKQAFRFEAFAKDNIFEAGRIIDALKREIKEGKAASKKEDKVFVLENEDERVEKANSEIIRVFALYEVVKDHLGENEKTLARNYLKGLNQKMEYLVKELGEKYVIQAFEIDKEITNPIKEIYASSETKEILESNMKKYWKDAENYGRIAGLLGGAERADYFLSKLLETKELNAEAEKQNGNGSNGNGTNGHNDGTQKVTEPTPEVSQEIGPVRAAENNIISQRPGLRPVEKDKESHLQGWVAVKRNEE